MAAITSTAAALRSATTRVDVSAATAPSSGQILTATGSTTATWQTASGGGEWELVSEAELSSSATDLIDATSISTDYDAFRITFIAYSNSNNTDLQMRLNNNSSAVYNLQWLRASNATVAGTRYTGTTYWDLGQEFAGVPNGGALGGTIYIRKPLTTLVGLMEATITHYPASTSIQVGQLSGLFNETSNKISRIHIFSDTATSLVAGSFALIEGYKKT